MCLKLHANNMCQPTPKSVCQPTPLKFGLTFVIRFIAQFPLLITKCQVLYQNVGETHVYQLEVIHFQYIYLPQFYKTSSAGTIFLLSTLQNEMLPLRKKLATFRCFTTTFECGSIMRTFWYLAFVIMTFNEPENGTVPTNPCANQPRSPLL